METLIATCVALIICALLILAMVKSSGSLKSGGSMNTTMLGAQDLMLTKDQKRAAEVIVELKSGKKLEEQDMGELFSDRSVKNVDESSTL